MNMNPRFTAATFALLAALAQVCAKNVTVNVQSADAATVFADVVRQAGKNYVYAPDLLKGRKVTVKATDEPLKRVLERMFSGTGIAYEIKGNNVVLRKAATPRAKKETRYVTVSGFVREAETGEALAGATVYDTETRLGANTNAQGFYSLRLPVGKRNIQATCFDFLASPVTPVTLDGKLNLDFSLEKSRQLEEVVVIGSRDRSLAIESPEIGRVALSAARIKKTPVLFGESDVTKTLQLEPGVNSGMEGFAGMVVHGGAPDENLYMLDNVPLYQVNHFAGLFSAFNTDAIRNAEFYKMTFPAKYDGRLSSYLDVTTIDGNAEHHKGIFTLGLTSGALSISGPIWKGRTTYAVSLRRSWYDVLTIPALAIINSVKKDNEDEKVRFRYDFTDLNAKINHRFSDRSSAFMSVYYGEDFVTTGTKLDQDPSETDYCWNEDDKTRMHWGNIVASAGWRYAFSPKVFGEITGAYSRYFSKLSQEWKDFIYINGDLDETEIDKVTSANSIDDWIVRGDFSWQPRENHRIETGAGVTFHNFRPSEMRHTLSQNNMESILTDSTGRYRAIEANAYIGDSWTINRKFRLQAGIHLSLFHIDGKTHHGISPRLSLSWNPTGNAAVKAGYSRTTQYVHQLTQSYISLPTDQWVPVTAEMRPQTADKIALGGYYTLGTDYTFSVEGWWKWMRNLVDYRDEYYLLPPQTPWDRKLVSGDGIAKGIDFKIVKESGKITGQIAYTLMWADRTFPMVNGGRTFPARFDNRHKINVTLNWRVNEKWELNAAWTGMSGNRYTLPVNVWQGLELPGGQEELGYFYFNQSVTQTPEINNYRLPFYHRLDLSAIRHTRRGGYWTFSLYNAYCNMNVIAVHRSDRIDGKPCFKKLRLIPLIPSVSYTWKF